MSELDEQALAIFAKNFSHITASGLLRRSKIKAGLGDEPLVAEDLPAFLLAADAGVRVFAQTPDVYATMRRELAALLPSHSAELDGPEPVPTPLMEPAPALGPAPPASEGEPFEVIEIRSEQDVRRARMRARALAQMAGASTFSVQRLVTAVSELARNIVLYAREGWIELSHQHDPLAIHVRAVD